IYMVFMPAIPGLPGMSGATPGITGDSERANVRADLDALATARLPYFSRLAGAPLETVESDPELLQFALAAGRSAFGDNCATCHGSGAQGFKGYPNLNDDVWLWGGTLDDIRHTLRVGIRSGHPEMRFSQMPSYGRDGIFGAEDIADLTQYVLALSGRETDAAAVARASENYDLQCSICHGADGRGDRSQGSPDLTDAEWLYGGTPEEINASIYRGPYGVMPSWEGRLDEAVIDALAVYVHTLGGGEPG
ncbi:MAG: cytochrome-c oxidase, cbb3-type subunit III, partial [Caulobacterales bacterium]|nr:cytochrome-c oxidase, cbb3-type subunit III [Caulobacterales bacterium]